MLSDRQQQHYVDKGWLVVEDVFGAEDVQRVRALATELATEDLRDQPDAAGYAVDRSTDGSALPRKIAAPFLRHELFRAFVLQEKLTGLVHALLGAEALLATDQIFMKPPRHGSAKPFHQDNYYFQVTPQDHLITAWIALDDVDEENGCLQYVDGSHTGKILEHSPVPGEAYNLTPDPALIDTAHVSCARVKKGGVVFHHGACLHRSGANTSARWRRAYATHWVTAKARSASGLLNNAYFMNERLYCQNS